MRLIDADRVCDNCTFKIPEHDSKCGFHRCLMKTLPTIEAVPVKHGRWVVNTDDFTPKKRCTYCGYNKPIAAGVAIKQEPEFYCPNCGAKMDLKGECKK